MRKVLVVGCPGAGKSTFARKLRDKTGLPLWYLDRLWHRPDGTDVGREAFDAALAQVLKRDAWIIDGNYSRTLERRLTECDTVFLIDLPTEECLAGAAARIGRQREDLPWVETEFNEEFRQYIIAFATEQLPGIRDLLKRYADGREIVVFHSRVEADRYVSGLPDAALLCRETVPTDLPALRALWADGDTMRFVGFPDGLHRTEEEMAAWYARLDAARPQKNHYSVYENGRYCGETFYAIDPATRYAVMDIKLAGHARGRGIAAAALRFAIGEAMSHGAAACWVDPREDNEKARALYERVGMVRRTAPPFLDVPEGYAYYEYKK